MPLSLLSRLLTLFNFGLAAILVYFFYDTFFYAPMGVDAGYFLSFAERIAEGQVLYQDVRPVYTPLAMLILGGIRRLCGDLAEPYSLYLGTVLAAEALTGVSVYFVTRRFCELRSLACFVGLITVIGAHLHEGNAIILEPFVTLFYTAALYFFLSDLRWKFLLAGMCTGLAFLSKQYGALGMMPFALIVICSKTSVTQKLRALFELGCGALVPLLCLLAIFFAYGVSPVDILLSFWVPGYIREVADMSRFYDFIRRLNPYLLAIPFCLFFSSCRRDSRFWLFLFAFLALSLSLIVRPFGHYFILIVPPSLLLGAFLVDKLWHSSSRAAQAAALLVTLSLLPMVRESFRLTLSKDVHPSRAEQYEVVREINAVWPAYSRVIVFADPWIVFAGKFLPVLGLTHDYGFWSNYSPEQLHEVFVKNDKIITDLQNETYFDSEKQRIEERYGLFEDLLKQLGYCVKTIPNERYRLWDKSCPI